MGSAQSRILKRLEESRNAAVERVADAALAATTVEEEQAALVKVLIKRDRRAGWVAMIKRFDKLSSELQDKLLDHPKELFGPLSEAIGESDGRENVIEMIRKASDPRLVLLLIEALSDSREEVRRLAARSFADAIWNFRWGARREQEAVPDQHRMRRAVEFALLHFKSHRQVDIVRAALMFERVQDGTLWPMFADPHEDATREAANHLRLLSEPELAGAVLLALGSPLKMAAIAGISALEKDTVADAVARESYRMTDPVIGKAVEAITHCRYMTEIPVEDPWMSEPETWIGWYRLVERLALPAGVKVAWYRRMIGTAEAGTQGVPRKLLVLGGLTRVPGAEAAALIGELAGDADRRVARSAARALRQRKTPDRHPAKEAGANLRRIVSGIPGKLDRVWKQFGELPPVVQANTSRTLSTSDAQFDTALKSKLTGGRAEDLSQALRILLTLPKVAQFRDQIIALCGNADARVVATAIKLLGRMEDPKLGPLLEAAAKHHDGRVRANAIESMEQLKIADRSTQVLAMMNSRHNRERANAIKAISTFDFLTARDCLVRMLNDENASHRLSALWVVSQLGMLDLVRQVASTARLESNPRVRKMAREMLAKLNEAAAVHTVKG